ncbi:MAG: hypothetical protein IT198_12410 [Acidimicrobiia bacterium]|nr:hypothetical protein [Acidimicrobiia bacterium]
MRVSPDLVLAQWAVGMSSVLFVVTRWRATSPGFAWLVSGISAGLAVLAWLAAGRDVPLLLVAAGASVLSVVASRVRSRLPESVLEDVFEATAGVVGVVVLAGMAVATDESSIATVFRTLAGAAFVGSVTDEMALGHWYLIDPKLPKVAIARLNAISMGALGAFAAAELLLPGGIVWEWAGPEPLVLAWMGLVVFSAVLLVLVRGALREPGYAAVMSATGLSYVATMVAFGALVVAWMA